MTAPFAIRPARSTDAAAIRTLTRRAYTPWIALTGREPLPMQVDDAAAMRTHEIALIESSCAILGMIETTQQTDSLSIVSVAVDPASQGQGLG